LKPAASDLGFYDALKKRWYCRAIHEIIRDVGFNFQQLPIPSDTNAELQEIMTSCWHKDAESR
jgi:hypothetical protein